MKMPWLSGRRTLGTASASLLAALLFTLSGNVSAGIADTRHNLGSAANAISGRNQTTSTAEICVFCHTPHGADVTPGASAPLWNKRLGAAGAPAGGGTYTSYATLNTPSLQGAVAAVGSISMACLSCHDGTQAMDNIINAPGSGGYDTTGGGNNGLLTYTWTGANVAAGPGTNGGTLIGANNVSLIGTNLSNDHPIGIPYCGGGVTGTGTTVTAACADEDFQRGATVLMTAQVNSNQVFWVDTGAVGRQRTDFPLYTRSAGGAPMVECGTCHDPHVSTGQTGPTGTGRVAGETFLRISNASSAVCLACHIK